MTVTVPRSPNVQATVRPCGAASVLAALVTVANLGGSVPAPPPARKRRTRAPLPVCEDPEVKGVGGRQLDQTQGFRKSQRPAGLSRECRECPGRCVPARVAQCLRSLVLWYCILYGVTCKSIFGDDSIFKFLTSYTPLTLEGLNHM